MTTYQEILETLQVQLQLNIELLNLAKEKTQILKVQHPCENILK